MRIFVLFITLGIGLALIMKSVWLVRTVGQISWAERHLGRGGSYTMYKLIGLAVIVAGMIYATGLIDRIFGGIFGTVFGGLGPAG